MYLLKSDDDWSSFVQTYLRGHRDVIMGKGLFRLNKDESVDILDPDLAEFAAQLQAEQDARLAAEAARGE